LSVTESNKEVVEAFCAAYTDGDWDRVGELLAEDFRWVVPTSQRRQSAALADAPVLNESPGWTRDETLAIFRDTQLRAVDGRFDLVPLTSTAEDDRVALEARSSAVNAANGRVYENRYHHLFRCRDGRIVEMREYQDTLHVYDVWMAE
jgi:ketosteroid isomerase-like protein